MLSGNGDPAKAVRCKRKPIPYISSVCILHLVATRLESIEESRNPPVCEFPSPSELDALPRLAILSLTSEIVSATATGITSTGAYVSGRDAAELWRSPCREESAPRDLLGKVVKMGDETFRAALQGRRPASF